VVAGESSSGGSVGHVEGAEALLVADEDVEYLLGRMERHGGSAVINSRPGAGTEVVMRLPRRAP